MVVPLEYGDRYFPVKYFLNSYRALADGKRGIGLLEKHLESDSFFLAEWKIIWIGACSVLRTSVDLFKADVASCINQEIRNEIQAEWDEIKSSKDNHRIFWEFLRKERNNILHQYEWGAYEAWINEDGEMEPARINILAGAPENVEFVLAMRGGLYDGRNTLELLREGADWVEARLFAAIHRAGFDPNEERNAVTFEPRPPATNGFGI